MFLIKYTKNRSKINRNDSSEQTMDDGPWTKKIKERKKIKDGPWTMDHGRWTKKIKERDKIKDGPWTMDDGRWTKKIKETRLKKEKS